MRLPIDPLLSQQWHLINTTGLLDSNVALAWTPGSGPAHTDRGTRTLVINLDVAGRIGAAGS